jgi:acetamidase/formamidase
VIDAWINSYSGRAPGALFSAGDGHAAQGHGEVDLTAIETGLRETNSAEVAKDVVVPIDRPFFGTMGLAPDPAMGRISSGPPGVHTGNLDNKDLVAGTTRKIPVYRPQGHEAYVAARRDTDPLDRDGAAPRPRLRDEDRGALRPLCG